MENVGRGETHWSKKKKKKVQIFASLEKSKTEVIIFNYVRLGKHRN